MLVISAKSAADRNRGFTAAVFGISRRDAVFLAASVVGYCLMRSIRPLTFVLAALGLLAACVSDGASLTSTDAGADASSGGSSSGDGGGNDGSSSSSSSGGDDGGNGELPNLGCSVQPGHQVLHLTAGTATVGSDGTLASWRNLVGPEVGQPDGSVGQLVRRDLGGRPAIFFENVRATPTSPMPDRRVRFAGLGKVISGSFALFVVGNHKFDFSPGVYDASSVGATYLFSGGASSRLQLMGRYHLPSDAYDGFGALLYSDIDVKNHVGVYSDTDFLDQRHIYQVVDAKDGSDFLATMTVDGNPMPTTRHPLDRLGSTGTTLVLGGSDRPDQMLAGSISEVILLSQPDPGEVDCIRQRLSNKYAP